MTSPRRSAELRCLQLVVAVLGLVPVGAGLAGMLLGSSMTGPVRVPDPGLDSHVRYLSGLLLGVGAGFWSTIPRIGLRTARFRLLTAIVVTGGIGRAIGFLVAGVPPAPMALALAMELVVTPLLCLWQSRIAGRVPVSDRPA